MIIIIYKKRHKDFSFFLYIFILVLLFFLVGDQRGQRRTDFSTVISFPAIIIYHVLENVGMAVSPFSNTGRKHVVHSIHYSTMYKKKKNTKNTIA